MNQEIQQATVIEDIELKRQLQSLACAKYKILKKHPHGRDIHPDDTFSFNYDFSCPMKKVKIQTIASKVESSEERKETLDRIDDERKHQMEARFFLFWFPVCKLIFNHFKACIVRIMKDRKHMKHNDLIHQVTQQLTSKFSPDPLAIKRQIEYLIEVSHSYGFSFS
jgi:cullin 3